MFDYKPLRKWRKKCKLTQTDVHAKTIDLKDRSSIAGYELGKSDIGAKNLGIIIDLFSEHLNIDETNEFVSDLFEISFKITHATIDDKYVKLLEENNQMLKDEVQRLKDKDSDKKRVGDRPDFDVKKIRGL